MTDYPHRYGATDRATEHYATACVTSAQILRREGHPLEAADLEAEARDARNQVTGEGFTHPHDHPDPGVDNDVPPEWWR